MDRGPRWTCTENEHVACGILDSCTITQSFIEEQIGAEMSASVRDLWRSLQGRIRSQPDPIIHRVAETLLAAQVPLHRLHRDMSQEQLNLLPFTACLMTKTGASPTKVVRRKRRNLTVLCFLFRDTLNDLGAESGAPNPAALVIEQKSVGGDSGGPYPGVNPSSNPTRDRNGSCVAALAAMASAVCRP